MEWPTMNQKKQDERQDDARQHDDPQNQPCPPNFGQGLLRINRNIVDIRLFIHLLLVHRRFESTMMEQFGRTNFVAVLADWVFLIKIGTHLV